MTKSEFLNKFFIEYDKVASNGAPGYTADEISQIASEAQESLIIKKYGPNSNRLKEGFEETEKRIQEIGELVTYKTITSFTTGFFDNAVYVTLPNTLIDTTNANTTSPAGPTNFDDVYWYTIYEDCVSNRLDCTIANNTTVYVKPDVMEISHDEFLYAERNPFRKPFVKGSEGRVFRLRSEGRKHQLVTDGTFTITAYKIGYIKKPRPIDLVTNIANPVSELNDSFHRELLHETVQLAKQYVQDPSLQLDKQNITE